MLKLVVAFLIKDVVFMEALIVTKAGAIMVIINMVIITLTIATMKVESTVNLNSTLVDS